MLNINPRFLKWNRKLFWLLFAGSLTLCMGIFWFYFRLSPQRPPQKIVEIAIVKKQKFQQSIRLLGVIHPQHATYMAAKGSGVLDILIPTGQKISKGALIAKIDNPDIDNEVLLSQSAETIAKSQLDRLQPLLEKGYVSGREIEEKKQEWITAQKEFAKMKMERDNLRFYAPFDGIIGAYKKREGAQINAGDTVVTVYDPETLVVDFDIPCSNLAKISVGQRVYVFDKAYPLDNIQRMLDEETHMCPADVKIACEDCLIGSTVPVRLVVTEKNDVITIPFQALFLKNGIPHVYIVEENKIVLVEVKIGAKQEDRIEIITGLQPGQQLVLKGQERLYPEMSVEIDKTP